MRIKNIFFLLGIISNFLILSVPVTIAAPIVDLEMTKTSGCECSVEVVAKNMTDLNGCSFALSYDPSALEVINQETGAFLQQSGAAESSVKPFDNSNGLVGPIKIQLSDPTIGADGSGVLAKIDFKAKKPVATVVAFSQLQIFGIHGAEISHTTNQQIALQVGADSFYGIAVQPQSAVENGAKIESEQPEAEPVVITEQAFEPIEGVSAKLKVVKKIDKIEFQASLENSTSTAKVVEFPSSQRYDIEISKEGFLVYRWSDKKLFLMSFEPVTIRQDIIEYKELWELPANLQPGNYEIIFSLTLVEPVIMKARIELP